METTCVIPTTLALAPQLSSVLLQKTTAAWGLSGSSLVHTGQFIQRQRRRSTGYGKYSRLFARTNRGAAVITKTESAPAKSGKDQKHHGPSTLSVLSSQCGRIAWTYNGALNSSSRAAWRHPSFQACCVHAHLHTLFFELLTTNGRVRKTESQASWRGAMKEVEASERYARRISRGTCRSER
ncbi:hypothetical protein LZ32DRAFT_410042 [Colletotrichum eremochloae]|nr:hypothetical protein LY78DRAFT_358334 [Colletotrichum sublineola]KAK2009538.1 hypothetical protein LZ32DRAFT_410042 [Colletotrichum eremochloae]